MTFKYWGLICAELGSGDREREDSGSQTGRISQKPAELHFWSSSQQPVREQVITAASQRPPDVCGGPHHCGQKPARLAGQVMLTYSLSCGKQYPLLLNAS